MIRDLAEVDATRRALRREAEGFVQARSGIAHALRHLPAGSTDLGRDLQRARQRMNERLQEIGAELEDVTRAERRLNAER